MRTIIQIKTFTSDKALNTFLSTASNCVTYIDLKPNGDELILIFEIKI